MERRFPLNLQFFAEPDGGEPTPESKPAPTPTEPKPADADAIAGALLESLEKLQRRKEPSLVKSYAEKYGLSESELTALLEKAKAEKAAELPEAVKKQIAEATEKANGLLIAADVKSLGAAMGLLDAETALLLLDKGKVKVDEDGKVTGVKEALEALQTDKPYLFGEAKKTGAWGAKQGTGGGNEPTAKDEIKSLMFGK